MISSLPAIYFFAMTEAILVELYAESFQLQK